MPRWHWREHGLEANGQEDNLLMRVRAGDGQRFGGRVHHADVGAAGLGAQQVGVARAACRRRKPGSHRFVTPARWPCRWFQGGDADRTPGTVHQFDLARDEFVHSVAHDGVRLAAADLHQDPGTGHGLRDLAGLGAGDAGIAVFIQILQCAPRAARSAPTPASPKRNLSRRERCLRDDGHKRG
jgi:hypothetical protein